MGVPLLIFLHGLGQTPQIWQDQVTELPVGTKAVAPWLDGLRPGADHPFDLGRAADAVLSQLNRYGVDSVALCGTSLGASVALEAAIRSPAAVSHLVLSGLLPRTSRLSANLQKLTVRALPADRLGGINKAAMISALDAITGIDLRRGLPKITARTLVISGDAAGASQPAAEEVLRLVSGARAASVPDAGPAAFNRLLYDFLD